jgi:hypothetical protein
MSQYTKKQIADAATLIQRMQPLMLAGMSFEDAGRAVLKRDEQLVLISDADDEKGTAIRDHLSAKVYDALKRKAA